MRYRGPIIAGVVAGVIAIALALFLVMPKTGQVQSAQEELLEAEQAEVSLQAALRALQDAQAQAPQTEEEIQALEDAVPPTADLPGLFRLLQSAADRSAVDFFQFSPGNPTPDPSGGFSVISSSIVVTGSYFSLEEYLYNLETLPRASKVTGVSIAPAGASDGAAAVTTTTGRLQMQLTVEFYTTDLNAGPGALPVPGEEDAGGGDGTETASPDTPAATDTPAPTGPTGAAP